jgi:hypothetical protein
MLKFTVSEDQQWLILTHFPDEVEKKQVDISLTKKVHNHFFHPLVKKKIWDGNICFVDKRGPFWRVPIGLWREVMQIGEDYNIKIEIEGLSDIIDSDFTLEKFTTWVDEFFADAGMKPRDYQIETAWKILKFRYSVSEVATSSGKTLISFMIFAYLKSQGLIRKYMMIAPNTNLVIQGSEDFDDYGLAKLGVKIQQIGGGSKLRPGCDLIIGTFQSLVKQEAEFFEEVDAVFVDECLSPDSLVRIENGKEVRIDQIKKGDVVLTVNEKSKLIEPRVVDLVHKNLNKGYQIYEIETEDGRKIKITGNHKVRLKNGEWKKVEDLDLSDELFDI